LGVLAYNLGNGGVGWSCQTGLIARHDW